MSLGRYGRIMRAPGALHAFGGLTLSRIALGGTGLMTLLFVRDVEGSFGAAGAVLAAYTIGAGIMQPVYGRLADRRGQTWAVLLPVAAYVAGMTALIVAGQRGASTAVLVVLAAVGGAALPPVSALIRPLLPVIIGDDEEALAGAYAFDAILIEVGFVTGPLIGSLIIAVASPAAGLGAMIGFVVAGAIVFSSAPASRTWRSDHGDEHRRSALRAPGLLTLVLAALAVGVMFGSLEVGLPAFAAAQGKAREAGFLMACVSLASGVGGFAFGARKPGERSLLIDYLALLFAIPAAFALMLAAGSMAVMGVLALLAGATIAPLVAAQNQLVPAVAPRGSLTEAFTWMTLGITAGVAVGASTAGILVDASGWRAALLCGCVVTAGGGLFTLSRRATLAAATA